jgi:hypothetical protein
MLETAWDRSYQCLHIKSSGPGDLAINALVGEGHVLRVREDLVEHDLAKTGVLDKVSDRRPNGIFCSFSIEGGITL